MDVLRIAMLFSITDHQAVRQVTQPCRDLPRADGKQNRSGERPVKPVLITQQAEGSEAMWPSPPRGATPGIQKLWDEACGAHSTVLATFYDGFVIIIIIITI
jgi:hypothetical protein